MSRFFKSALFPILIVVVLAFFAQRIISPGDHSKAPNFTEFQQQIKAGQVESATFNTKDNTIDFTSTATGKRQKYTIGYGLDYGERYRNLPYVAALNQTPR